MPVREKCNRASACVQAFERTRAPHVRRAVCSGPPPHILAPPTMAKKASGGSADKKPAADNKKAGGKGKAAAGGDDDKKVRISLAIRPQASSFKALRGLNFSTATSRVQA